jgi:hypothetical protein
MWFRPSLGITSSNVPDGRIKHPRKDTVKTVGKGFEFSVSILGNPVFAKAVFRKSYHKVAQGQSFSNVFRRVLQSAIIHNYNRGFHKALCEWYVACDHKVASAGKRDDAVISRTLTGRAKFHQRGRAAYARNRTVRYENRLNTSSC